MSANNGETKAMTLNTASSVISYVSKIEQAAVAFYSEKATGYEGLSDLFSSFVSENQRNEKNIKRAYYSVVSDALETNFCFEGLRADVAVPNLSREAPISEVLRSSIELEESMGAFYKEAADLSKALMGDVARAMNRVAKLRRSRLETLQTMLEKE